ncbi:LysM peptidoglycan-binding domain-containing protein [Parasedimentitalea marina]|nr:LysM peptidoglycan-binding domain-containing protein [Parasedimentitalea marina]
MAGTAGSGGLGALAIGGIAAAAVVIGGVVLVQFGVFQSDTPVVDPVETVAQVSADTGTSDSDAPLQTDIAPTSTTPSVTAAANTNAPTGDENQATTDAQPDSSPDQEVVATDVTVAPDAVVPETHVEEVTQAAPIEQPVAAADGPVADTDTAVSTETETGSETDNNTLVQVTETPVQEEATEQVASATKQVAPSTEQVAPATEQVAPATEQVAVQSTASLASETATDNLAAVPDVTDTPTEASDSAEQNTPVEAAEDIVTAALAQPEQTAPEPAEEAAFVLTAPKLDIVRFDTDGAGLIAGRAQVGVEVSVLLDGKVLDRFEVQNGGEFVSFSSIEPSPDARVVSLQAAFDGQVVMSDATFILAPSQVASAVTDDSEQPVDVVDQPEDVHVAQADVTADVPQDSVADEDVSEVSVVAAADAVAGESAAETAVEVTEVAQEPATDQVADVENKPVEFAEVEDEPVETVETAMVDLDPVSPPVAEATPQPEVSPVSMAILKADAEGVELVQPATPIVPELVGKVSLDIISYSEEGDVELAGRAGPDSLVRVYLDNSPVADIQAADDGSWKGQLSDVAPGIYTLRLDELDTEGKVLSRLETPFKREAPEVLQPLSAVEDSPAQAVPPIRAVTVQKGDTLWAISRERYGDGLLYVRVVEANQAAIRDPDLIYPGQIFSIPE